LGIKAIPGWILRQKFEYMPVQIETLEAMTYFRIDKLLGRKIFISLITRHKKLWLG